jgi:hypothetical protein
MEGAIAEEAEAELAAAAEPEAETGQDASDGDAEGLYRSEDEAADEFAGEGAAPGAVGESEFSEEGAVELEAAGGAEQEALKAAADEEPDAGRLAARELDAPVDDPSVGLTVLRVIEIGLAAALIVLIGLTLWVRQRG